VISIWFARTGGDQARLAHGPAQRRYFDAPSSGRTRPARLAHPQIVDDRGYARDAPGDSLGPAPGFRTIHRSGQRDFAIRDVDLDLLRCLGRQLGGEPVAHVALDALVLALYHDRNLP
jgi:hypothetical protein